MRKKEKIFIIALGCLLPLVAIAQTDTGLDATAAASGLSSYGKDLPGMIGNVIGSGLSLIAVIFFILMVYGGFLWMTAHGKDDQVKKAQDTIIAAIIGIIVVLASYALTSFVFKSVGSGGGATSSSSGSQCQSPASCQNIDGCSFAMSQTGFNFLEIDEKRRLCRAASILGVSNPNYCETGLCSGGSTNVCCR